MKILLTLSCILFTTLPTRALEFNEALIHLKKNEDIQRAINQIHVSEAQLDIALSTALPTLSLQSSFVRQASTQSTFVGKEQRQTLLNLRQPLFRGFKSFRSYEFAKQLIKTQELAQDAIMREVQFRFIDLYFDLLKQQKDISLLEESLVSNRNNLKELEKRMQIGRSRKSEVLSTKTQLLRSQGQLLEARERYSLSQKQLARLLNKEVTSELTEPTSKKLPDRTNIVDDHPSLKAAKLRLENSEIVVSIEKSDHYPTVNLNANYYLDQEGNFNQREWDFSVNLNLPLYEGGRSSAEIREAKLQQMNTKLEVETISNDLKNLVSQITTSLSLATEQLKTLQESVKTSYDNYQEIKKEYDLKLTNSIEVNNALESYLQEKRRYESVRLNTLHAEYKLLTLAGSLQ
jgi:outer membrane protein